MDIKVIAPTLASQFIANQPAAAGLFLQTPSWFKFQSRLGRQGEQLGFFIAGKLIGLATAIWHNLPGGWRYVYVPRGPVVAAADLAKSLSVLSDYYKTKNFIYLRVEPPLLLSAAAQPVMRFIKTAAIQPEATAWLDLNLSSEELLNHMHPKTRYNIRLSQKKDLVWELVGQSGLDDFWHLLQVTAQRDGFKPWPRQHYEKMVELFAQQTVQQDELAVRIAQVKYNKQTLAASLLVFSNNVVTYLVGASTKEQHALMPNYYLHWRTIQEAKKLGYKYYDWWGVAPVGSQQQAWQGITRFKLGWGGVVVNYMGAYDYVYQPLFYRFYKLASKIKQIIYKLKM